jgi:hypothetical protein
VGGLEASPASSRFYCSLRHRQTFARKLNLCLAQK